MGVMFVTSRVRARQVYVSTKTNATRRAWPPLLHRRKTIVLATAKIRQVLVGSFDVQQPSEASHQHGRQRPRVGQGCLDFPNQKVVQFPPHRLERDRSALGHAKPQPPVCLRDVAMFVFRGKGGGRGRNGSRGAGKNGSRKG